MNVEFVCANCEEQFQSEWTDEEARAEAHERGFDPAECELVCTDCYQSILKRMESVA